MKVTEALAKGTPTLSFEFFPPKTAEGENKLFSVVAQLKKFHPDFISVTYGALGTTREKTFFWVEEIKKKHGLEPVAHLTCVAATRDDIAGQLDRLEQAGVTNILALRGDPPEGEKEFVPPRDGFKFARELVAFIKKTKPRFCVGAAGFPEGHPGAPGLAADTDYLKQKIDAGAEYVISQLFFDNRHFEAFARRCGRAGIDVPLIPGLMPITNLHQVKKMTQVCGATIPGPLLAKLEKHQGDAAKIGAEHTLEQARSLIRSGVPGLHFFVMNQSEPIAAILSQLRS